MATAPQHLIAEPIAAAARRMPAALVAGSVDVAMHRVPGAAHEWLWRSPSGGGRAALAPLSGSTTGLTVTADAGTAAPVVDALTVELLGALERTWAPTVPPAARPAPSMRLKIAAAVVAVLVPALAVAGSQVLAPPAPMDVAAAVDQFRDDRAAVADVGATPAASPAATADRDAGGDAPAAAPNAGRQSSDPVSEDRGSDGTTAQTTATGPGTSPASRQPSASRTQSTANNTPQREPRRSSAPSKPAEGVYRYATQGYESIDRPSSRHDYPSETAMTIRHNDCGFVAHWQPLENRWDEMTICRSQAGSFIPTMATHREFYGQSKDSRYRCSDGFYAYRPQPGATWTGRCTDDESRMDIQARTLGREALRVGDQTVEAVHYVIDARISGGNEGTWRAERWIDPRSGLLLRAQASTDATSDSSVGTVRYREQTDVRLLSMTPQR